MPTPLRACVVLLLAGCASLPPPPATLEARVTATLEGRGPAGGELTQIDDVLRGKPAPPHAPPVVLELLEHPLRAVDAAAIFERSVPASLRRFVEQPGAAARGPEIDIRDLLEPYLRELAEAQLALVAGGRGHRLDGEELVRELRGNALGPARIAELLRLADPAGLRRSQDLFLAATLRFAAALRASAGRIRFPPLPERFESAVGTVQIGGMGDDEHAAGAAVIVDPGGDDTYRREPVTAGAISVVVDLGGNDRYLGRDVAVHGLSALLDLAGRDRYEADGPGLAAAVAGASLLLDFAGDDVYEAGNFAMGAATFGLGLLVDFAGDDRYRLRSNGQGHGGAGGLGLLWDLGGDDQYFAAGGIKDAYDRGGGISMAQGAGFGVRPPYGGGVGILRDDAGDDRYEAEMFAQGVAYWYALGLLWDRGGNDRYRAVRYAQGNGVHMAAGTVRDEAGNDRYELAVGVGQGMGLDLAVGVLYDGAGHDEYRAPNLAQGAATANGIGLLYDAGGRDRFQLNQLGWGVADGERGLPSTGLFLFDPATASFER